MVKKANDNIQAHSPLKKINQMQKTEYILVPKVWLEGLLSAADEVKKSESDPYKLTRDFKVAGLIGYANSAKHILKYNKKENAK